MSYDATIWRDGDIITHQMLNKIENGVKQANANYVENIWKMGTVISPEKLNNIELGIQEIDVEYEPTQWANLDLITAEKLNKIEDGVFKINEDKNWDDMDWSDIIIATKNGKYKNFQIHATKTLDLGTIGVVTMEIIGIDEDELENGSKVALSFMSKQSLNQRHRMNPEYVAGQEGTGSLGGWGKTEIRAWLISTILPNIPANVRNAIKPVKKYSTSYDVSGAKVDNAETVDVLWIPSEREMNGNLTNTETLGPIYSAAFTTDASRKKLVNGAPSGWWLRTAGDTAKFKDVSGQGVLNDSNSNAQAEIGVAIGFCL